MGNSLRKFEVKLNKLRFGSDHVNADCDVTGTGCGASAAGDVTLETISISSKSSRRSRVSRTSRRRDSRTSRVSGKSRKSGKSLDSDLTRGSVSSRKSRSSQKRTPRDIVGEVLSPVQGQCLYSVLDAARSAGNPLCKASGDYSRQSRSLPCTPRSHKVTTTTCYTVQRPCHDTGYDVKQDMQNLSRQTRKICLAGQSGLEHDGGRDYVDNKLNLAETSLEDRGHVKVGVRPLSLISAASNATYVLEEPSLLTGGAGEFQGCGVPEKSSMVLTDSSVDTFHSTYSDLNPEKSINKLSNQDNHDSLLAVKPQEHSVTHTLSVDDLDFCDFDLERHALEGHDLNRNYSEVNVSSETLILPEADAKHEPIGFDKMDQFCSAEFNDDDVTLDDNVIRDDGVRRYDDVRPDDDITLIPQEWTARGEELLLLDRAVRVPVENQSIQDIYTACRGTVRFLLSRALRRQTALSPEEVCVLTIGSVPADTKVMDMDALDLLILFRFKKMQYEQYFKGMYRLKDLLSLRIKEFWDRLTSYIEGLVGKNLGTGQNAVWLADFFRYPDLHTGHVWCLELRWDCACAISHEHVIRIHVSPAVELQNYRQSNYLLSSSIRGSCFDGIIAHPRHADRFVTSAFLTEEVTPSGFVRSMHEVLAGVSPHVLPVLRLLKFLLSLTLPHKLVCVPDARARYRLAPYIPSHALQSLVHAYAQAHSDTSAWDMEHVTPRLCDLLEHLIHRTDPIMDFITRKQLLQPIRDKDIIEDIRSLINAIIFHDGSHVTDIPARNPDVVYVRQHGRLHVATLDLELTSPQRELYLGLETLVYPSRRAPVCRLPLVGWCRGYVEEQYARNPGADLRKLPPASRAQLWYKYCDGTISLDTLRKNEELIVSSD